MALENAFRVMELPFAIQGGTGMTEQTKKGFRGERDQTGRWFIFLSEKDMRDSADFGDGTLGKNPGHRPPVFPADEVVAQHRSALCRYFSHSSNGGFIESLAFECCFDSRIAESPFSNSTEPDTDVGAGPATGTEGNPAAYIVIALCGLGKFDVTRICIHRIHRNPDFGQQFTLIQDCFPEAREVVCGGFGSVHLRS